METVWMARRHMEAVVRIEAASFAAPWSEQDFCSILHRRNAIGKVAEHHGAIIGYMVYLLLDEAIEVVNLAVDPPFRRQGFGRNMLRKLAGSLCAGRRTRLVVPVSEYSLPAQLWLRACGLRAQQIIRNFYGGDDRDEDAYLFVGRLSHHAAPPPDHLEAVTNDPTDRPW